MAGSIFMGGGIVALHYIAMSAMRLRGHVPLFSRARDSFGPARDRGFLDGLMAGVLLSGRGPGRWKRKIASALLMGAAIVSMHYTAMAAASFTPSATPPDLSHAVSISTLGIAGISGVPVMVLVLTLLTSMADRLQEQKTLLDELFEQAPDAVALVNGHDRVVRINREFTRIFGYAPEEALGRRLMAI